ncbi:MAG: DUF6529 family protein, partial [Dehalococcoidia bacterium]
AIAVAAALPADAAVPAGSVFDRTVVDARASGAGSVAQEEGVQCSACHSFVRPGVRFCTACGARMPDLVVPAAVPVAAAASPPAGNASSGRVSALPRRRRSSSFSTQQWIALGFAALAVVFINAVGLWLTQAGRSSGEDGFASGITTYIYDNLPWFKSGMTLIALALAGLASYDMWLVVVDRRERTPETYRRLRQYHRLMGYAAALIAFAIGFLTCVGIFGFDFSNTRRAIHTVVGTTLLVVIVAKIATVRAIPRYRRYLNVIGFAVLAFYALTFATSAVPWVWGQITGDEPVYYGNPYR